MRNIAKSGIIGLAVLTVSFAGVGTVEASGRCGRQSCNKSQQKNRKQYKRADTDRSGKISNDEFRGSDKRFCRMDKNDDGEIGKWEYSKNKHHQKHSKQYKRVDSDGSGKISSEEYRGSDKRFDRIDKNDDGEIGKWEYRKTKHHHKNN